MLMEIKGVTGQIKVYRDRIIITRKGYPAMITHFGAGEKTLFFKHIGGLQVKLATMINRGYISFHVPGFSSDPSNAFEAVGDSNSVTFKRSSNAQIQKLQEMIESGI